MFKAVECKKTCELAQQDNTTNIFQNTLALKWIRLAEFTLVGVFLLISVFVVYSVFCGL